VYHDKDASGKDGLFRASTSGGEPQRLGDYPTSALNSLMSISPDGRKILVHVDARPLNPATAGPDLEFAVLENFTPQAVAAPRPAARPAKK
jgi:Tol biopolymer transport system component